MDRNAVSLHRGCVIMSLLRRGLVGLLLGWMLPAVAWGNPVNAEKLLNDPQNGGFGGSFRTDFAASSGNVQRLSVGASGGLQYWTMYPEGSGYRGRPAPEGAPRFFKNRWVLLANAAFVRFRLAEVVSNGFTHMRYTRMWIPRLGSEVFTQAQYNEFTHLNLRLVAGTGLRVDPIRKRRVQVWAGTGYMVEYERNRVAAADPHPAELVNHRWTSYGVLQLMLHDSAIVARATTYAQPLLTDFSDIRVLESIQLEARALPVVSLGIELDAQYDSRPPLVSGVLPLDLMVTSYVRVGAPASP